MNTSTYCKVALAVYIGFLTGLAAKSVGQMPEADGPYPWWLPILMFGVVAVPAVFGYLAGRSESDEQ